MRAIIVCTILFSSALAGAQEGSNPDAGTDTPDASTPPPPPPAPPPAPEPRIASNIDRVLPLCASPETGTRRFCIEELVSSGDPLRRAHDKLRDLAARDEELHQLAANAIRLLYREEPPPYDTSAIPLGPRDPGRTHVVFFPTAYPTQKGEVSWDIVNLAYWDINYGVSDNVEIGLRTGPPVGALVLAPQVKFAVPFAGGSFAVHVLGGAVVPFFGNTQVFFGGGGPILSLGEPDRFFNLGFEAYAFKNSSSNSYDSSNTYGLLLPHFGGSIRLGARTAFNAEVIIPGFAETNHDTEIGKLGLILYGFRIIGSSMWGDISFAAPICSGCGELYHYLPLGVPLLGFGFAW